jgi:hypothetical protein
MKREMSRKMILQIEYIIMLKYFLFFFQMMDIKFLSKNVKLTRPLNQKKYSKKIFKKNIQKNHQRN